jgi:DNA-binding GntR family transcriptional regulator
MKWTTIASVPWAGVHLGDVTGKLLSAERLDKSRIENLAWDHALIPEAFANKLTREDLNSLDFVDRWISRQAIAIFEIRQQVSAVPANSTDQERLGIRKGAPILQAIETYLSSENEVLGIFLSHYRPGRIELHSKFRWPSKTNPHTDLKTVPRKPKS